MSKSGSSDRAVAGAVQRPAYKSPLHLAALGVLMGAMPEDAGHSRIPNWRIKALADALAETQRSDSDEPAK